MYIFISPSGVTGGSCKIGGCPFGHPSLPSLLSQIFGKKKFFHGLGKRTETSPEKSVLNLLKKIVINFFLNFVYFPTRILYLINIWFLRDGPKCPRLIRLQNF